MLEGLPYVAILLLLLLLLLVLFLILLFIVLFLLCESRLSTRQSKVDGTVVKSVEGFWFTIVALPPTSPDCLLPYAAPAGSQAHPFVHFPLLYHRSSS